ncbi:hypothetical protein GTY41_39095 [Streptomyces sp. SID685]|uniref:hypothetical protein n=1 Tax=Streptomyces sp. SID685 TaxID=2690322 RepID=UPI001367BEA2|nr:hypothetical protein [Streptomyces sp. SID685]MYR90762.1 hypothetical protein [Streptomyces sp. SID685]
MLERIGRLVLTYVALHAVTWAIIALIESSEDSFTDLMWAASGMLALVGIPTLLLALVAGLAHRHMETTTFRAALAFPMVFFAWPTIGGTWAAPVVFQVLCQIAFAAYLMPAPLVPENWTAKPSLEFVEKLLGET